MQPFTANGSLLHMSLETVCGGVWKPCKTLSKAFAIGKFSNSTILFHLYWGSCRLGMFLNNHGAKDSSGILMYFGISNQSVKPGCCLLSLRSRNMFHHCLHCHRHHVVLILRKGCHYFHVHIFHRAEYGWLGNGHRIARLGTKRNSTAPNSLSRKNFFPSNAEWETKDQNRQSMHIYIYTYMNLYDICLRIFMLSICKA